MPSSPRWKSSRKATPTPSSSGSRTPNHCLSSNESTGQVTRFTNGRDPSPRSRRGLRVSSTGDLPNLDAGRTVFPVRHRRAATAYHPTGLRECQIKAVTSLEASLKADKPRALVQMATGSGKTFTAITEVYRLLKHAGARRILFPGRHPQPSASRPNRSSGPSSPNDDNRTFTGALWRTAADFASHRQRQPSRQSRPFKRMYATLKVGGTGRRSGRREPRRTEVAAQGARCRSSTNATLPPEYFDDGGNRRVPPFDLQPVASGRRVFRRVPDRPHGHPGQPHLRLSSRRTSLANTPTKRPSPTRSNVGNDIYLVETQVSQSGETIRAEQLVERRERQTRARRWEVQDERGATTPPPNSTARS